MWRVVIGDLTHMVLDVLTDLGVSRDWDLTRMVLNVLTDLGVSRDWGLHSFDTHMMLNVLAHLGGES